MIKFQCWFYSLLFSLRHKSQLDFSIFVVRSTPPSLHRLQRKSNNIFFFFCFFGRSKWEMMKDIPTYKQSTAFIFGRILFISINNCVGDVGASFTCEFRLSISRFFHQMKYLTNNLIQINHKNKWNDILCFHLWPDETVPVVFFPSYSPSSMVHFIAPSSLSVSNEIKPKEKKHRTEKKYVQFIINVDLFRSLPSPPLPHLASVQFCVDSNSHRHVSNTPHGSMCRIRPATTKNQNIKI